MLYALLNTVMTPPSIRQAIPGEALLQVGGLPYPKAASGKVREIYELDEHYLIVSTDRMSAFDVILPTGIPGKGIILTQLSLWWFERTSEIAPNHLGSDHEEQLRQVLAGHEALVPRAMLVRKLEPFPVEAVVRGYLSGSAWVQYRESGQVHGHVLPAGLRRNEQLPEPLFTPTTKAKQGHDEPLTEAQAAAILGEENYRRVKSSALEIYRMGTEEAGRSGLILADTKFEFGHDRHGQVYLIDEVLTPDSSRYWPRDGYEPGRPQASYDKQIVRDYLESLEWDKTPPGPELPEEVVVQTQERYLNALERLMG